MSKHCAKNGCGAYHVKGSLYCINHTPGIEEARREWQSKGGKRGKRKAAVKVPVVAATEVADLPDILTFIDAPEYMDLADVACPAVKTALAELFAPDNQYSEAAFSWGIGAGKSFLTTIATSYMIYRTLCLTDPQGHYGLAPGSQIQFANYSVTAAQAKHVVYTELKARLDHSPCFQQPGFQYDEAITSELRWVEKGVRAFPGNSRDTSALGYNILAATLDEASWLEEVGYSTRVAGRTRRGEYDQAEELYNALSKRMVSRGNANWRADSLFLMISSPRYVNDFLTMKLGEAKKNNTIFASRLATWQGAPEATLSGATFDDPICGPVPIEYSSQFTRNPERARRDLGIVASEQIGSYFAPGVVGASVRGHTTDRRPDPDNRYFVHVDLGLTRDAAGMAMCHRKQDVVIVDKVWQFRAEDFSRGAVDFAKIRHVIFEQIDEGYWVASVNLDGFQSADFVQRMQDEGINSGVLSCGLEVYDTLQELMAEGRCWLPEDEVLLHELNTLEILRGVEVDHAPRGSKDVADAVAGAVYTCITTPPRRQTYTYNLVKPVRL